MLGVLHDAFAYTTGQEDCHSVCMEEQSMRESTRQLMMMMTVYAMLHTLRRSSGGEVSHARRSLRHVYDTELSNKLDSIRRVTLLTTTTT